MNEVLLTSKAERLAEKAENLSSFSGLKLLHVKKQISLILGQIGKNGIFDEYTKHDISHIDFMLDSLEWIIPLETQEKLTSANWLMITLSIYFHDLGMLVTKEEFKERKKSSFTSFKQSIIDGNYGLDYKDKIISLDGPERQDRFIYQEFVRKTHAERIKYWILDEFDPNFQNNTQVVSEIKKLISNIDYMFRRDLALICESHHLSDLDDFDKYKPNQQYGPTSDEVVNLHYSALILRTADLLHITSDRTPSIEYNLINPTDPISQEEWAKQKAIKAIRPQVKKNSEGILDNSIPKDTLEIIALFQEEKGFFGLVSYINYANKQLKDNYKYNEAANKSFGNQYDYPWRNIDDSNIETKDFEKRQFEFVLDQTKILDLLVGHTLYNDSTVVLRELIQNGIDASKLKRHELDLNKREYEYLPEIKIKWQENTRELSFLDNGTGMTLDIIQNHLLKVGSSRYQDESFKKKYPNFSAISRFGIGLLTCFLIADDIDILTKSCDSDKAILLKIKKIHGKYLLKYLSPDKIPDELKKHGTEIKLHVRADVDLSNIEEEIKKWILIPKCKLSLEVSDKIISIGYESPGDILKSHLKENGFNVDEKHIRVKEIEKDGVTLAFALRYIEHWKEWDFLEYTNTERHNLHPIGTCIEGIRVDFNTPGFRGRNLYALVNTSGKNAPKTNVARSNIELTPERESLLFSIYQLYLEHISGELQNLRNIGFSITWAANEANWMLNSFIRNIRYSNNRDVKIEDFNTFERALSKVKFVLIEKNTNREVISVNELKELNHFWSIDCASYSSADSLIKEVKSSNTSALSLLNTIFENEDSNTEHIDYLLCNQQSDKIIDNIITENFQVDTIKLIPEQRRLDLRWSLIKEKIWEEIIPLEEEYNGGRNNYNRCLVQLRDIEIDKSISQIAINSSNALFILRNSELNTYLVKLINELSDKSQEDRFALSQTVSIINSFFYYKELNKGKIEEFIQSRFQRRNNRDIENIVWNRIDKEELITVILKTNFIKYDTTIWYRRELY
ncbi:ATP-binding protein [Dyadobacter luteus]|uniref:ATP-binding protein n=1 Tax=Dyadobacter luteus TaxID=2259619 RepID=A0A3D8YAA5_9BACT|nr:ATP-binding protein [Dyadobacter luteus]REA60670.1 ATP-binding protein [Dyadobacter luteus]